MDRVCMQAWDVMKSHEGHHAEGNAFIDQMLGWDLAPQLISGWVRRCGMRWPPAGGCAPILIAHRRPHSRFMNSRACAIPPLSTWVTAALAAPTMLSRLPLGSATISVRTPLASGWKRTFTRCARGGVCPGCGANRDRESGVPSRSNTAVMRRCMAGAESVPVNCRAMVLALGGRRTSHVSAESPG